MFSGSAGSAQTKQSHLDARCAAELSLCRIEKN
jgi:hypothetical protein